MSKHIAPWHSLLFCSAATPTRCTVAAHLVHQSVMQPKQTPGLSLPQSCNEAHDLLLLQEYAYKVAQAQMTLEETQAVLHDKTILSNSITAQDRRTLHTACCCLNSLRIRVEALANVVEQSVRRRQLSLMQNCEPGCSPDNLSAKEDRNLTSSTPHCLQTSSGSRHP